MTGLCFTAAEAACGEAASSIPQPPRPQIAATDAPAIPWRNCLRLGMERPALCAKKIPLLPRNWRHPTSTAEPWESIPAWLAERRRSDEYVVSPELFLAHTGRGIPNLLVE